jgi:hypothetical protein
MWPSPSADLVDAEKDFHDAKNRRAASSIRRKWRQAKVQKRDGASGRISNAG